MIYNRFKMGLTAGFELKEFNAASLTGSFQTFGSSLANPGYHMTITNASNVDVYLSTTGTSNDIRIAANTSVTFPSQRPWNPTPNAVYILNKNKPLYIRQVTASGVGTIIANILTET